MSEPLPLRRLIQRSGPLGVHLLLYRQITLLVCGLLVGFLPAHAQDEGGRNRPCDASCEAWIADQFSRVRRPVYVEDHDDDDEDFLDEGPPSTVRPSPAARHLDRRVAAPTRKSGRPAPKVKLSAKAQHELFLSGKTVHGKRTKDVAAAKAKQKRTAPASAASPRGMVPHVRERRAVALPSASLRLERDDSSQAVKPDAGAQNPVGAERDPRPSTEPASGQLKAPPPMKNPDVAPSALAHSRVDERAMLPKAGAVGSPSEILGLAGPMPTSPVLIGEFVEPTVPLRPLPEAFKALRPYYSDLLYAIIGDTAVLVFPETRRVMLTF
jgi:hypothetical protein